MLWIRKWSLSLIVLGLSAAPAGADNNAVDYLGLSVRGAALVQNEDLRHWRIKGRISNESTEKLVILGVLIPDGLHSLPFKLKVEADRYVDIGSLTLQPEEQLDLSSSHVVIEFDAYQKFENKTGGLELQLHTVNGYLPFVAHLEEATIR
ncbi:MAG: hypothetical protein JJ879_16500 [Sneathiella sp.]|nr:hypothetical protein [Sneathiella sp.]